jgi:hypothetical protein
MAEATVTADTLAGYLRLTGKAGSRTLHVLGKYQSFTAAIASPVGREILNDAIQRHDKLLDRVASLDATDIEKAEYKALREVILRWSEKIVAYEANLKSLNDGVRMANG